MLDYFYSIKITLKSCLVALDLWVMDSAECETMETYLICNYISTMPNCDTALSPAQLVNCYCYNVNLSL